MPSIQDMLRPPPLKLETPQERDARMAEFHKRFPALAGAASRVPAYRTEAEAYDEGIFDDD